MGTPVTTMGRGFSVQNEVQDIDVLVIEADAVRADTIGSAPPFLGDRPRFAGNDTAESGKADWCAIYIGDVVDLDDFQRQLDTLGDLALHLPLLVANDSPLAAQLPGALPGSRSRDRKSTRLNSSHRT